MENAMKRLILAGLVLVFTFATGVAAAAQSAQSESPSLGDYARAARKNKAQETKSTPKVYDNDNIAPATSINVVGEPSAPATDSAKSSDSSAATTGNANAPADSQTPKNDAPKITPGQSREDRQKVFDSWKQRLDDQRTKIDQLSQEISTLQKVTTGSELTGLSDQQYAQSLGEKEKALEDAKASLIDMEEEARKAGVPSSVTE
jgi:hypothetical protein